MNLQASGHLFLQARLRQALSQGELRLAFQSQVEIGTERALGAETLLRWSSPELGEVPPERFIPVAEGCGLIVSIRQ